VLHRFWQASLPVHFREVQHDRGPTGNLEIHGMRGSQKDPKYSRSTLVEETLRPKRRVRSPKPEQHSPLSKFPANWHRPLQRLRHTRYSLWRRNLSHDSLSCQIPSVFSEELVLSRLIRCELFRLRCHGHSLLLSSYLRRIKRKNFSRSACGHPLQDLTHLFLDCHASEPLRRAIFGTTFSIFDLWSRPWGVARLLS